MDGISLYDDCVMLAYNKEVRRNCLPFTCGENDLDDFFLNDADLYADELLGKTYCWVTAEIPHRIVALFTLSNDSIYNPQIQISAESETKRSIFREKDKTKRSKKESAQHSKSRNKSFVMTSVSAL